MEWPQEQGKRISWAVCMRSLYFEMSITLCFLDDANEQDVAGPMGHGGLHDLKIVISYEYTRAYFKSHTNYLNVLCILSCMQQNGYKDQICTRSP